MDASIAVNLIASKVRWNQSLRGGGGHIIITNNFVAIVTVSL